MPSRNLQAYRDKRLADATPEPFGRNLVPATGKLFVVQQHQASHLHYDLRLEMDGVLRSWAVPKGPSPHMKDKRFAAGVDRTIIEKGAEMLNIELTVLIEQVIEAMKSNAAELGLAGE